MRNINVEDIIISSDGATSVTIKFVGGGADRNLLRVYLDARDTVVSNFGDGVDGERDQALKMSCSGVATVSITVVGTGDIE